MCSLETGRRVPIRLAGLLLGAALMMAMLLTGGAYAAGPSQCETEGYISAAIASTNLTSNNKKSGRISVEYDKYVPMSADVAEFRVGHRVTLSVSGKIDVNRHYWEERKCKYFGLKCWYEPREASNWKNINARPIITEICRGGIEKGCTDPKKIESSSLLLNTQRSELEISDSNSSTVMQMRDKFEFQGLVDGNGVIRARCTGARPSTCSDGTYSLNFSVDVKPRLVKIQTILKKRQAAGDVVHPDFIDSFMESQPEARKAAACLLFKHAQEFYPATGGSRLSRSRETLVRRAIKLDPHLQFRLALSSLMIANGRIDEAKIGVGENLATTAAAYEKDKESTDTADNYAIALKNAATIWLKDRVGNEGADLEIAVSLLDTMIDVRQAILLKNRTNQDLLLKFVRGQQHRARVMTMIRSRTMMSAAEKSLATALDWTPKYENAEITGVNHRRGEFVAYLPDQLSMPLVAPVSTNPDDGTTVPEDEQQIGLSILRLPSWTARATLLPGASDDDPVYLYKDGTLDKHSEGVGKDWIETRVWRPSIRRGADPAWRYFNAKQDCSDPSIEYLGGYATPGNSAVSVAAIARSGGDADLVISKDNCLTLGGDLKAIDGDRLVVRGDGTALAWKADLEAKLYVMKLDGVANEFKSRAIQIKENEVDRDLNASDIASIKRIVPLAGTDKLLIVGPVAEETQTNYLFLEPTENGFIALRNISKVGTRFISANATHALVQDGQTVGLRELGKAGGLGNDLLHGFTLEAEESACDVDGRIIGNQSYAVMTYSECTIEDKKQVERLILFDLKRGRYEATLPDVVSATTSGYSVSKATGQDVYRIRLIAAASPGRVWRQDGGNGARLSDGFTHQALTSANHRTLPKTSAVVSTGLRFLESKKRWINLPIVNGSPLGGNPDEANTVLGFCAQSAWGCKVAPFFDASQATPSAENICRAGTSERVLLIALGGVGQNDRFGRVTVTCSGAGQISQGVVDPIDADEAWSTVALVPPANHDGASHWRLIEDAMVAPERQTHVAMRLPVTPPRSGETLEYDVPVATIQNDEKVIPERVSDLRLSAEIRAAVAKRKDGIANLAKGQVAAVVVSPKAMTIYRNGVASEAGDTLKTDHNAIQDAQVGPKDTGLLIGSMTTLAGATLVQRVTFVDDQFKIDVKEHGAAAQTLTQEWTSGKRMSRGTPFKFFGTTEDLGKAWLVDNGCGRVYDFATSSLLKGMEWVSGRPGSLKILFGLGNQDKDNKSGIVIERRIAVAAAATHLSSSLGYIEFWNNVPHLEEKEKPGGGNCAIANN